MSKIKEACEKTTEFIESCFDENNVSDGLTFDERLKIKIESLEDEDIKNVLSLMEMD